MPNCNNLQRSLDWCMGTPELPGIKRRVYYISKNQVAQWPTFVRDDSGRVTSSTLAGSFTLVADAKWHFIVILADKSQLTSDAQGEVPSQTQLNKATLVHPGVGPEATAAAAYLNIHCVIKGILNSNGVVSVVSYSFNGVVELYIIVAGGEGG